MHTNHSSTSRACPVLFIFPQKLFCSNIFDSKSVFNQIYMISEPVTLIDLLNTGAGKRRTLRAKINSEADDAISYLASSAIRGLAFCLSPAAWTRLLFPEMRVTDCAIDSAGRKHKGGCFCVHGYVVIDSAETFILFTIFHIWILCDPHLYSFQSIFHS